MSERGDQTGSDTNGQSRPKPLTARQERLAAALAGGRKDAEACRECRVGVTTLRNWRLGNPGFTQRIRELQRELVDRAVARLAELMAGKALDALTERLSRTDPKTGALMVGLDDIKACFEIFVHTTNAAELKQRLELLEAAMRSRRQR
jgi:hypothetical protein